MKPFPCLVKLAIIFYLWAGKAKKDLFFTIILWCFVLVYFQLSPVGEDTNRR